MEFAVVLTLSMPTVITKPALSVMKVVNIRLSNKIKNYFLANIYELYLYISLGTYILYYKNFIYLELCLLYFYIY
jgi:hypothetical protein